MLDPFFWSFSHGLLIKCKGQLEQNMEKTLKTTKIKTQGFVPTVMICLVQHDILNIAFCRFFCIFAALNVCL